jgi:protein SCO1/2
VVYPAFVIRPDRAPWNGYAQTAPKGAGDSRKAAREPEKGKVTEKGLFTIAVAFNGRELAQGANSLTLIIRDKREGYVTGAQVAVTPWLPAGGHGVWEKPVVTDRGEGYYRVENVVLARNGQWDLRVSVRRGTEEDRAVFSFPVGAGNGKPREDAGGTVRKYPRTVKYYKIPDVTLLNQDGKKIRLRSYLDSGKPVIVDFIYTTCTTVCPVLSAGFVSLRNRLGETRSVQLISLSIDPENDRPENMKQYLAMFHAGEGWDFLTGSREDITSVLKAFDAYIPDKMEHQPLYILRGPKSDEWVRISGLISGADLMREFRGIENK